MQPFTEQQSESLVAYSQQRDFALAQLSDAKSQLAENTKKNKDLTESNSQIVGEIAENKKVLKDLFIEIGSVSGKLSNDTKLAEKELEVIEAKKAVALSSLNELLGVIASINDSVKDSFESAKAIKNELINVKQQVTSNVAAISVAAEAVSSSHGTLEDSMKTFKKDLTEKVVANDRRSDKLDAREEKLNVREEALNLTYSEVVAKMSKDGKKLSDLNQVA